MILPILLLVILSALRVDGAPRPEDVIGSSPNSMTSPPWRSLSWALAHHTVTHQSLEPRTYRGDQTQSERGTLIGQRSRAYLSQPFSLKAEWEAWVEVHALLSDPLSIPDGVLNRSIVKGRAYRGGEYKELIWMRKSFACSHWQRYERFVELSPTLHQTADLSQSCPQLSQYLTDYGEANIELLFIGDLTEDPASAFGHMLLGVEAHSSSIALQRSMILSFSVPSIQGMWHALRLLFTGGEGVYQFTDLIQTLERYRNGERRDIWRYPLKLSSVEKRRVLMGIWSLTGLKETYTFAGDNCASKISLLMANATQNFDLYSKLPWPRAPLELITLFAQAGYLAPPHYLPNPIKRQRGIEALLAKLRDQSLLDQTVFDRLALEGKLNERAIKEGEVMTERGERSKREREVLSNERAALLQRMVVQTPPRVTTVTKFHIISESAPPHTATAYPELKLGIRWRETSSDNGHQLLYASPLSYAIKGRWRGQGFDERIGIGQMSDREWSLLDLSVFALQDPRLRGGEVRGQNSLVNEADETVRHTTRRLLLGRLSLLQIKQRTLSDDGSWSWDFHLAYESGFFAHYLLGKTWGTSPLISESLSSLSKSEQGRELSEKGLSAHQDRSQLFSWLPVFPSSYYSRVARGNMFSLSQWRLSLLGGTTLLPCHQLTSLLITDQKGFCLKEETPFSLNLTINLRGVVPVSSWMSMYIDHASSVQSLSNNKSPFSTHRDHLFNNDLTISFHPTFSPDSNFWGLSLYTQVVHRVSLYYNVSERLSPSVSASREASTTLSMGIQINR